MTRVVVVDYGMGNIKSVQRGLEQAGAMVEFSHDPDDIRQADRLVLPGVGAFENGMAELQKGSLDDALREFAKTGRPLLGICLGMQMLFDWSEEHGHHDGLGIIPGKVIEIPQKDNGKQVRKIPHVGWNTLKAISGQEWQPGSLLQNVKEIDYFYFVHSFMVVPENDTFLLAQCDYEGISIAAAVQNNNVYGFQFHPEKSGEVGLEILEQFLNQ